MVRKRAEGLCRRIKGLVKVSQAFRIEEVPGYRTLQVNTGKFGSGISLSIRRGVGLVPWKAFNRKFTLENVYG